MPSTELTLPKKTAALHHAGISMTSSGAGAAMGTNQKSVCTQNREGKAA